MNVYSKISTFSNKKRWWLSVIITSFLITTLVVAWVYAIKDYGLALFILAPLFIGFSSTAIYGYKQPVIIIQKAFSISLVSMVFTMFGIVFFVFESLVCVLMAAPISILLVCLGSLLGIFLIRKAEAGTILSIILFYLFIVLIGIVENKTISGQYDFLSVKTSIKINTNKEKVWKNVVSFSNMEKPPGILFKIGVSYPIYATIHGTGEGAIRRCIYTTGEYVEPITVWDQPNELSYNIKKAPQPVDDVGVFNLKNPHLQDYIIMKRSSYKFIKLSENETRLDMTTWYYHKIRPGFYWSILSNYIIGKVQESVLDHVKLNAEK